MTDPGQPFVETVRIQNFGCARDVTLELTRLHALIGPNDSGKTTVLQAIRIMGELVASSDLRPDRRTRADTTISMGWFDAGSGTQPGGNMKLTCTVGPAGVRLVLVDPGGAERFVPGTGPHDVTAAARGARLVRWDPDAIRQPSELIPEPQPVTLGERGERLSAAYDSLLSRDRDAFIAIEAKLRALFPTTRGIWLPALDSSKKALGVVLDDGTRVQAEEMSEGLLYWLAFAILPHVAPTAILLIEEPENGLHPSRIADVMKVLRDVSTRTQVILATHSPLVINELAPTEVTILTRDRDRGTQATRLDRTKNFQQRQQVYALGELWLSYADGVDEAALVNDAKHDGGAEDAQGVPGR